MPVLSRPLATPSSLNCAASGTDARSSRRPPGTRSKPQNSSAEDGSVTTKQVADITLPREELERIWNAEYLERLARTYWRFLTRVSLGILRIRYGPDSRPRW